MPVPYYVKTVRKDGQWSSLEVVAGATLNMSIAAVCLHYGQAIFEGMKAYRHADGRIALFRPEENAKRMQRSAERLCMQAPDTQLFLEGVTQAVVKNEEYLPPYGTGATMYIRPLLIGTGAQMGVKPSSEYTFIVMVMPVWPYYKGWLAPIKAMVSRDYIRAFPWGTGAYKVAWNYAASLLAWVQAKKSGYSVELYLDAVQHRYIDECGTANFFGIQNGTYVTPLSESILPSITNMSLITLAEYIWLKVERRPIDIQEVVNFSEVGACGTAAVITPICEIFDPLGETYTFGAEIGKYTQSLYDHLTHIQFGSSADMFEWMHFFW